MAHRYYSLHRPISIGCYPKYQNNKPLDIVNYPYRQLVNISYNLMAWGYIEFKNPINRTDAEIYSLVKAPKEDYGRLLPYADEVWKHFKGNRYKIMCIAEHTETKKKMVVYRKLARADDTKIYTRPLEMFMSEVDHIKYPKASQKYRFERV